MGGPTPPCEMELRDYTPAPRAMLPVGSREPIAHVPSIAATLRRGAGEATHKVPEVYHDVWLWVAAGGTGTQGRTLSKFQCVVRGRTFAKFQVARR